MTTVATVTTMTPATPAVLAASAAPPVQAAQAAPAAPAAPASPRTITDTKDSPSIQQQLMKTFVRTIHDCEIEESKDSKLSIPLGKNDTSPRDWSYHAWYMFHATIYNATRHLMIHEQHTGSPAMKIPDHKRVIYLLTKTQYQLLIETIGSILLFIPCVCKYSARPLFLTIYPPPSLEKSSHSNWWKWGIEYHNLVRDAISLERVSSLQITQYWNWRFHGIFDPNTSTLLNLPITVKNAGKETWTWIAMVCWAFPESGYHTMEGNQYFRDHLRYIISSFPCHSCRDDGLHIYKTFPPPIEKKSRVAIWIWFVHFRNRIKYHMKLKDEIIYASFSNTHHSHHEPLRIHVGDHVPRSDTVSIMDVSIRTSSSADGNNKYDTKRMSLRDATKYWNHMFQK